MAMAFWWPVTWTSPDEIDLQVAMQKFNCSIIESEYLLSGTTFEEPGAQCFCFSPTKEPSQNFAKAQRNENKLPKFVAIGGGGGGGGEFE